LRLVGTIWGYPGTILDSLVALKLVPLPRDGAAMFCFQANVGIFRVHFGPSRCMSGQEGWFWIPRRLPSAQMASPSNWYIFGTIFGPICDHFVGHFWGHSGVQKLPKMSQDCLQKPSQGATRMKSKDFEHCCFVWFFAAVLEHQSSQTAEKPPKMPSKGQQ
jgi:hypothetical protein